MVLPMGNVHTVLQTKPQLVYRGAVIRVRSEHRDIFDDAFRATPIPSYMHVHRAHPSYRVPGVNIDGSTFRSGEFVLYLVIQPGGKWGYGDDMITKIGELGHMLEDATWYIDDEYQGYVQRWQLRAGTLAVEVVSEAADDVDSYVLRACEDLHPEVRGSLYIQRAIDALEYLVHDIDEDDEDDEYAMICADLEAAMRLQADPSRARYELARAYIKGHEPERTVRMLRPLYEQLDEANLAYGEPRRVMAETIDQLGIAYLALDNPEEALACFLRTKDLYGHRAPNATLRCQALAETGDFVKAREAAKAAISTQTTTELAESYFQLAILETLAGQPEAALAHANQYIDSARNEYQAKKRRERLERHHTFAAMFRDDPRFQGLE